MSCDLCTLLSALTWCCETHEESFTEEQKQTNGKKCQITEFIKLMHCFELTRSAESLLVRNKVRKKQLNWTITVCRSRCVKAGREWCCQTAVLPLVDVLREPAEALAVALSLQDAAHEHLQRPRVQLFERDVALKRRTNITFINNE